MIRASGSSLRHRECGSTRDKPKGAQISSFRISAQTRNPCIDTLEIKGRRETSAVYQGEIINKLHFVCGSSYSYT